MKRKLSILLALLSIVALVMSVSAVLVADENDEENEGITYQSYAGEDDSNWILVHTNMNSVCVDNDSDNYLIVKYDNYINIYEHRENNEDGMIEEGSEKFFINTVIQPHEEIIIPLCTEIYIKTSIKNVEKTGVASLRVNNEPRDEQE